jgi:hypothetical protein
MQAGVSTSSAGCHFVTCASQPDMTITVRE